MLSDESVSCTSGTNGCHDLRCRAFPLDGQASAVGQSPGFRSRGGGTFLKYNIACRPMHQAGTIGPPGGDDPVVHSTGCFTIVETKRLGTNPGF